MADYGHDTITTGYAPEIPLGNFLQSFHDDLLRVQPHWDEKLMLAMDQDGNPLGLSLTVRAPNPYRIITLNVHASENPPSVKIEFNGAIEDFSGTFEAARYIGFIVNEDIVCISKYVNSEFSGCWMAEPGMALQSTASTENKPSGCLSFLQPQREESLQVTSWTGKIDG
ncbi:MAG: hypothetical protein H7A35_04710 [Planctomycetales bacterium]|nr:hypothetical protein [bacterium]UNM09358.1 MAG: hypothetical protein H7A35_04710 [Planctomycetales bacterium]